MASRALNLFTICRRQFGTTGSLASKVAVLGASGGIGQPLSLLLKQSPLVSQLSLYDIQGVKGVAADLSHISTKRGGQSSCCHPGRGAAKPGMTRMTISTRMRHPDLITAVAKTCPEGHDLHCDQPAEILKKHNAYDPRPFGVTTLDIVRSNAFVAEAKGLDVSKVSVPVIGGHSGVTIIPVISQAVPSVSFKAQDRETLTTRNSERWHRGGERQGRRRLRHAVHGVRTPRNSSTPSCRPSTASAGVIECAFVESTVTEAPYFSRPLLLAGTEWRRTWAWQPDRVRGQATAAAMPELQQNIAKGVKFVKERY
uniref:Malate dehydrogenase n=1 Tax=Macrostomum lignano TaxID=282301 RepID=A0A1I8FM05_9PLAT